MSKDRIYQLARDGRLDPVRLDQALQLRGIMPTHEAWRLRIDQLLLLLGGGLMAAGVICFFAFNWAGLHHGYKFLLIGVALTAMVALASVKGLSGTAGQTAIAGACVLSGVLLAVAGQAYQSGADSELLFLGWAVFILPWVSMAKNRWLWLFLTLLLNTAGLLFFSNQRQLLWLWIDPDGSFWLVAALNGAAIAIWEHFAVDRPWLAGRAGPRILHLIVAGYATGLAMVWIFRNHPPSPLTPFAYLAWLTGSVTLSITLRKDIGVLSLVAMSFILVCTCLLGNNLGRVAHDLGGLFLMTVWLIGSTTTMAVVLRRLAARWAEA